MKIYDAMNRMADITPENVSEFVDWWLFRKAYEALHFARLNGQLDLEESVKIILAQSNISVVLLPVILAKAEHIKVLCEGDEDLFDFVWSQERSAPENPYARQYGADRFWSATGVEDLRPSVMIDDRSLETPYEVGSPEDAAESENTATS